MNLSVFEPDLQATAKTRAAAAFLEPSFRSVVGIFHASSHGNFMPHIYAKNANHTPPASSLLFHARMSYTCLTLLPFWLKENQVRLVGSYRSFTCIYRLSAVSP